MIESEETKERRRRIIQSVRECFQNKLGKYTHQRISDEWFFYGLGFTKDDMQYVFGFNAGFFKNEELEGHTYSHVGANVLVRTNGINPELRRQYQKFFRHELTDWITEPEQGYSSFRGGVGTIFPHYRGITTFYSDNQIIEFIEDAMDGILRIYNAISNNPDGIFNNVVCMNSRNETILALVNNVLSKDK
ncbi:MAG: hypothetical protein IJ150_12615 [Bacteroidales bacterium]|nr:hypothetical protein [Bacteroidales bacterium]